MFVAELLVSPNGLSQLRIVWRARMLGRAPNFIAASTKGMNAIPVK